MTLTIANGERLALSRKAADVLCDAVDIHAQVMLDAVDPRYDEDAKISSHLHKEITKLIAEASNLEGRKE